MTDLSARIPKLLPRKHNPHSTSNISATPPSPPPATPPLPPPPDLTSHTYIHPTRRILGEQDHALFLASPTNTLLQSWIFNLSDAVRGRPVSSLRDEECNDTVSAVLDILSAATDILKQNPAEETGSRFGNPRFRSFLNGVATQLSSWHTQTLGLKNSAQIDELGTYLHSSFGNPQRIDYGSGHELNFLLWLLCLNRIGLLPEQTFPAIVLRLFPAYLSLMRQIQQTYYLEPAGSHGVWGLDDYQFLPFLFGSAQLIHHKYITPKSIHNPLVLEEEGSQYLYLDQVSFVNSVKTVQGLRWHSPMLDDISSAKGWEKVEAGMRKMFVKEILEKRTVMQHFLFGSLVSAVAGMSVDDEGDGGEEEGGVEVFDDEEGRRHVHASVGWGDCCGIRVPAAVGAGMEERRAGGGGALRRVPFD